MDNDGDGQIDEGFDSDSDGTPDCEDVEECDGIDNDGDGQIDEGFDTNGNGTPDCDEEQCEIAITVNSPENEICVGETMQLTATVDDSCKEDGCVYEIIEKERCWGATGTFNVWLETTDRSNLNKFKFYHTTQSFEVYPNGDAKYMATASNGVDNILIEVYYSGQTQYAPKNSPKRNECMEYDTTEYTYWTNTSGRIVSEQHGTYTLEQRGPAFQMGMGGDTTRAGFGASGWFVAQGGDGFYTVGDVNIALGDCLTNDEKICWNTSDGNIVGGNDSLSIIIDQPGSYEFCYTNTFGVMETKKIIIGACTQTAAALSSSPQFVKSIYPVPAKSGEAITIHLQGEISKGAVSEYQVQVAIYDTTGAMVQDVQTLTVRNDENVINVNLHHLTKGMYFVSLAGKGWTETKQIVVDY